MFMNIWRSLQLMFYIFKYYNTNSLKEIIESVVDLKTCISISNFKNMYDLAFLKNNRECGKTLKYSNTQNTTLAGDGFVCKI